MNYKLIYQLREFGLTPGKIASRMFSSNVAPVLANSLPKAGTNLLSRTLSYIPAAYRLPLRTLSLPRYTEKQAQKIIARLNDNQIILAHLHYSKNMADCINQSRARHIVMFRDLRDVLVSAAHYMGSMDKAHHNFNAIHKLGINERINYLLGHPPSYGIVNNSICEENPTRLTYPEEARSFLKWLNFDNVLMVKYENLIGPDGGGSRELQLDELKKIGDFIGWKPQVSELHDVACKIYYRKAKTFRKGGQGGWMQEFNDDNKILFKEYLGDELVKLGYAQDLNW